MHHLHITESIKEIIEITIEFQDRAPLKNHQDFKRRKQHNFIKEKTISELFNRVDDKAAEIMLKEYKLLDLGENVNDYKYEHCGNGFSVYNRCTEKLYVI